MEKLKIGPASILSAAAFMMSSQECLRSDSDIIQPMKGSRYREHRIKEMVSLARDMAHEVERQMAEDSRNHP